MLAEEERREIAAAVREAGNGRAACLAALQIVQQRHGWISDELLRAPAAELGMTPDELDSVATFFSLMRGQGLGRSR